VGLRATCICSSVAASWLDVFHSAYAKKAFDVLVSESEDKNWKELVDATNEYTHRAGGSASHERMRVILAIDVSILF
jgi:hypothetical protein